MPGLKEKYERAIDISLPSLACIYDGWREGGSKYLHLLGWMKLGFHLFAVLACIVCQSGYQDGATFISGKCTKQEM